MNLMLKAIQKILRAPSRLDEYLELRRKQEMCLLGEGVWLHPESRVLNLQGRRNAIVIGPKSHIRGQLMVFGHGGNIQIGSDCFVGENSYIWSAASISIGDRVLVSHGVSIHDNNSHSLSATARHDHYSQILSGGHPSALDDVDAAPVVIEDDSWIGFNSTILKGVTICKGAVVGACSLVTKDVAQYTVVAGSPAKVIGEARL